MISLVVVGLAILYVAFDVMDSYAWSLHAKDCLFCYPYKSRQEMNRAIRRRRHV